MSAWKAIVFDLDDTLYPERSYASSGMRAAAACAAGRLDRDASAIYDEFWAMFLQGVRGDLFDRWTASAGLNRALVSELVQAFREHEPDITAFSGVPRLLTGLRAVSKLALLSDGYLNVQKRKLNALKLTGHFDCVVFSDAFGREHWKPSHVPFLHVMRSLGVSPDTAVYVADNPAKDFIGARELGMGTIRLRHEEGLHFAVEPGSAAHVPDWTIQSIDELAVLLAPNHVPTPRVRS